MEVICLLFSLFIKSASVPIYNSEASLYTYIAKLRYKIMHRLRQWTEMKKRIWSKFEESKNRQVRFM